MTEQPYFEDVAPGYELPEREHGPLTIVDTVRWAGLQENWQHIHYDRDHVRKHNGLPAFIASGALRQAYLQRMLTDWCGPRGRLSKLSIRHTHPTFEGDLMRYSATVVARSSSAAEPWIRCEFRARNQEDREILKGECELLLPSRP